jgi:histidinol dehydrogenase
MALRLSTSDPDFERQFSALLATKREVSEDVDTAVRSIITDVRARGDVAVAERTLQFDQLDLSSIGMRVSTAEIASAAATADQTTLAALHFAADRITAHHTRQLPKDDRYTDATGAELGHRWTAIEAVGLYVPGGQASYPSSVLMNALPAKVAGVPRVAMCVPAMRGVLNPLVLAAAHVAGVDEIYRIGGAQAIAALAYGTATVRAVAVP